MVIVGTSPKVLPLPNVLKWGVILSTYPPEVIFPSTNSQVLRDLLDTDGHQLVHVIKHDEAYGTMVTNVTAIEVQRSGTL